MNLQYFRILHPIKIRKRTIWFTIGILALFLLFSSWGIVFGESNSIQNQDKFGYFIISSSPEKGELYFDGVFYGSTPAKVKVQTDTSPSHTIKIKINGYEEYSKNIPYNPEQGQTIPIELDATHTLDNIRDFLGQNQ